MATPNDGEERNGAVYLSEGLDEGPGWYSLTDASYLGNGESPDTTDTTTSTAGQGAQTASDGTGSVAEVYKKYTGNTWRPERDPLEETPAQYDARLRAWISLAAAEKKASVEKVQGGFASQGEALKWAYDNGLVDKAAWAEQGGGEPPINGYDLVLNPSTNRFELHSNAAAKAKAAAQQKVSTGSQPILWTDPATGQRYFKSSESDQWQRETPLPKESAPKTPTVDELIMEAILSGSSEAALSLWNFANMPSQAERLKMAIAASQSPADYLATVGMMRGDIPIPYQPSGNNWRLGPESQAFAAYGVGGQGGGGNGGSANPLQDPALQAFIKSRGGGAGAVTGQPGSQGAIPGATGAGAGTTWQNPGTSPALDLIDRQIQALASAAEEQGSPEEQAQVQQQIQALQQQRQQVWQGQQSNGGNAAATGPAAQPGSTGEGGGGTTATGSTNSNGLDTTTNGADSQAMDSYQASLDAQRNQRGSDGLTTEQRWRREAGLENAAGVATYPSSRDVADPTGDSNMIGVRDPYGTIRWVNKNDQSSVNWARNYTKPSSNLGGQTANQSAQDLATGANLPSSIKDAYGKEVLSGAALKTRMSYPELGAQQGVTIPRFRSGQARSMQTPLEQRMFEAGLKQQGVDVPTYLWQENQGTTPGGSRRQRVQTGY